MVSDNQSHDDHYEVYDGKDDDSSPTSAILLLVALAILLVTFIVVLSVINPWMADFLSTSDSGSPTVIP